MSLCPSFLPLQRCSGFCLLTAFTVALLCPADPAVRFLLNQAAQPRCSLAQLIVVAGERPVDDYISWIGRQHVASLPAGRVGIVDSFGDPCGWKNAWAVRQSGHDASQRRAVDGGSADSTSALAASGKVQVVNAMRDAHDGFQDIVAAVRSMLPSPCTEGGGEGRELPKTLVLVDSVSCFLLRSGVQDVLRMIHSLCTLPATCVAFVLHTGRSV